MPVPSTAVAAVLQPSSGRSGAARLRPGGQGPALLAGALASALALAAALAWLQRGAAESPVGRASAAALTAPRWFAELLELPPQAPAALASADLLWQACAALLLLALVQAALAGWLAARRRRQLAAAVAHTLARAGALADPDGAAQPLWGSGVPAVPELAPLAQGIGHLHERLRALFDLHARQLETLRQQAHNDAVTGLPNQRQFGAMLEDLLSCEQAPAQAGLVLLRLHDLQGLNQRIGREAADRVLQTIASALHNYPKRVARCVVGRLSGTDFALLLPVGGLADETARSLVQALQRPMAAIDRSARVHSGAVELNPPLSVAQALALANATLARGTGQPVEAAWLPVAATGAPAVDDDGGWQRRLSRALSQGRVRLDESPVHTADGRRLHLRSRLQVQLLPGGAFEPAARWLALASGSRIGVSVDDKAVMLALAAIAGDGQARSVSIDAASAATPAFVESVTRRLEAAPEAACQLWVDLPEALALGQPQLVQALARRWRALGVVLALENAGEHLLRLPRLTDLGLACVRIDARFVNGIAADRGQQAWRYLDGLVKLAQSVGLSVVADGVRASQDLELLWAMGFDAAAGPALQAVAAPA